MKSRCSFILKAGLALVLCFVLLVGTMAVCFSAIVDDLAATGDTTVYYVKTNENWDNVITLTDSSGGFFSYADLGTLTNREFYPFYKVNNGEEIRITKDHRIREFWGTNGIPLGGDGDAGSRNLYAKNESENIFVWSSSSESYKLVVIHPSTLLNSNDYPKVIVYQTENLPSTADNVVNYYLVGDFDGDSTEEQHKLNLVLGTSTSYSATINIAQNVTRTFRIKVTYGDFVKYYGSGNSISSNNSNYTFWENNPGSYTTLNSDPEVAGDYTFTFDSSTITYGEFKIGVTYPNVERTVTVASNNGTMGKVKKSADEAYAASTTATPSQSSAVTISAQAEPGYFFTGWTTSSDLVTVANPKNPTTSVTASRGGTVTANFAKHIAAEGFTIYLNDETGTLKELVDPSDNSKGYQSTVDAMFAVDIQGNTHTTAVTAPVYTNTDVHHVQVPAGGPWNFVKFVGKNDSSIDSGWQPITSALTNSITYDDDGFRDIGFSTKKLYNHSGDETNGSGNIYFDNTNTNWTVDEEHQIYFIIGVDGNLTLRQMDNLFTSDSSDGEGAEKAANLYYCNSPSWDGYTYFGFALYNPSNLPESTSTPAQAISKAIAYTSFFSYYDLIKRIHYGTAYTSSYIGFGIGYPIDGMSVLDFLWIKDTDVGLGEYVSSNWTHQSGVSTSGMTEEQRTAYLNGGNPAHEGDYLNRGIKLSVTGTAGAGSAVSISGVTIIDNNVIGSYWGTNDNDRPAVAIGSNITYYYARTSTVTLSGLTPNTNYAVRYRITNGTEVGDWTSPNASGVATFTVPGGDENSYAPIEVEVAYSPVVTVTAGLAVKLSNGTLDKPDTLKGVESNFGQVTMTFDAGSQITLIEVNAKVGTLAQVDLTAGNLTLRATKTLDSATFEGWYNSSTNTKVSVGTETTYCPTTAGTYYAVYSHPVKYRFSYTSRDNTIKYYDQLSETNATYDELSSNEVDVDTRSDEITDIGHDVSLLVSVFNTTLSFDTRTGTAADGSPLTATISSRNDDTVSTKTNYYLNLYSRLSSGDSYSAPGPLVSVSGNYNKPIDLTAMELKNGDEVFKPANMSIVEHAGGTDTFYCWRMRNSDGTLGDVISTQVNYGFSLTGDLDIVPIFGTASGRATYLENTLGSGYTTTWKAFVDRSEVTKELVTSGISDLYNDTIVRFSDITNTSQGIGSNYTEYGVVILAQARESKSAYGEAFAGCNSSATVLNYLKALKELPPEKKNAKMHTATYGKAYAFYIPTYTLSNLNRAEICLILDNELFSGGQYIVASYAYKPADSDNPELYPEEYIISASERHDM